MPDWNPDREGHVKHKYIVLDATRQRLEGVQTSKGFMKFNKQGRMILNDPSIAHELRTSEIGRRDITVTRVRYPDEADRGHNYHFAGIAMPWHRYDENGKRIRDDAIQE